MTSQSGAAGCPFGRFHHVGVVVETARYDDTVDALCRLLGGAVSDGGEDEGLDMRWSFVSSVGNPPIEVATPLGNHETGLTRYLETHAGGLHHVSFETFDLDEVARHVDAAGLQQLGRNDDHGGYAELFVNPRQLGGALFHVLEDRRAGESSD